MPAVPVGCVVSAIEVVEQEKATRTCAYPGCDAPDPQPPYRYLRDGIPSVTAISGMLDLGKAASFGYAASLIAATVAVHEPERLDGMSISGCTHEKTGLCAACRFLRQEHAQQWREKANFGSHIHHLALSWAEGEDVDEDEATRPYLDAIEAFYKDTHPTWIMAERTVGILEPHSVAYRGKFDGIVTLDCPICGGSRCDWLIDWKTGRYYPAEQTLQLAAYRYARLTSWGGKTETVEGPVPAVKHAGVVLLSGEGTYRLMELPASLEAHGAFLNLRSSWFWHKEITKWAKAQEKELEEVAP